MNPSFRLKIAQGKPSPSELQVEGIEALLEALPGGLQGLQVEVAIAQSVQWLKVSESLQPSHCTEGNSLPRGSDRRRSPWALALNVH